MASASIDSSPLPTYSLRRRLQSLKAPANISLPSLPLSSSRCRTSLLIVCSSTSLNSKGTPASEEKKKILREKYGLDPNDFISQPNQRSRRRGAEEGRGKTPEVSHRTTHKLLQVLGGKARRKKLLSPKGMDVRPMMEVVRGAAFDILQVAGGCPASLRSGRWLDLYSGTGSVGIEAMSRGCSELVSDFYANWFVISLEGYLRTQVFLRVTCELKYFLSNWYQSKFWDQWRADFKKFLWLFFVSKGGKLLIFEFLDSISEFSNPEAMAAKNVDALEERLEGEMNQIKTTVEERMSSMEGQVADLRDMIKKMLEVFMATFAEETLVFLVCVCPFGFLSIPSVSCWPPRFPVGGLRLPCWVAVPVPAVWDFVLSFGFYSLALRFPAVPKNNGLTGCKDWGQIFDFMHFSVYSMKAHFVEMDPWVISEVLRPNLEWTGFLDVSVIHTLRVESFLERAEMSLGKVEPFDYISVTPPYTAVNYCTLMEQLAKCPLVGEDCFILVEYPLKTSMAECCGHLVKIADRRFGRTNLLIYGPSWALKKRKSDRILLD
ncbi:hypothetical protein M5K25_004277 [Dendrobium thyrsiflorum]|uniref:Uncharacterized protein n=1 Tax=Dendrobium thyrsiflorum TaxID=117978 RepID=A0ABD0VT70_DENTH